MMVPYHLHNPTMPAFVTTCKICYLDIEAGQSWRCKVCADYDVCNACYQKDDGIDHPHKLNNHASLTERDAQNKEARRLRVLQLGETKQEDFAMAHSQDACSHCSVLMASGNCFECKHCKSFQFGDKCVDTEQKLEDGETHPSNQKDNPILDPSETKEVVPHDTKDEDEILESEFADIRLDSERKKMLELLLHASHCCFTHCPYPNCRNVKGLFRHGVECKIRFSGGCVVCKKMWYLLQLHARACKESACVVPRCRDLKEHLQQSDFLRRDTVMRMMKKRAKDFASGS